MTPLRRHQLAWLNDAGWELIRTQRRDAVEQACLEHWARHRLPLVVTRQSASEMPHRVALGLPAPGQWQRRRIALAVPRSAILYFDAFPRASEVLSLLPPTARPAWRALCEQLAALHTPARVYGSFGWQRLTGLDHVHMDSDLDLWVGVSDAAQADTVAALLHGFNTPGPRLDGELVFDDGATVAWREWQGWRNGRCRSILVKRLHGATLADTPFWQRSVAVPAMEAA